MQIARLRRFLYDAELVDRKTKTVTDFTELVKKIGWASISFTIIRKFAGT